MNFVSIAEDLLAEIENSDFWASRMNEYEQCLTASWNVLTQSNNCCPLSLRRLGEGDETTVYELNWFNPRTEFEHGWTSNVERDVRKAAARHLHRLIAFAKQKPVEIIESSAPSNTNHLHSSEGQKTVETIEKASNEEQTSIKLHDNYDPKKQEALDYKNDGKSWQEFSSQKPFPSITTIKRYAKSTGQKIYKAKPGRPKGS